VRIVIPAAALLLGGAAVLFRGEDVATSARPAPVLKAERTPAPAAEPVPAPALEVAREAETARPSAVQAPSPKPRTDYATATLLRGRLGLSDERKKQVMEILDERAATVAAYESEVLARGWFRLDDFERRIGEIRELSYRRIAALLDAEQRAKFEAGRTELAAKDFISIAVPEENVACLD
jgi:hypothetical protein